MKLLPTSEGSVGKKYDIILHLFMPIDISVQVDKNLIYIQLYI
jgi:hypothetical protein